MATAAHATQNLQLIHPFQRKRLPPARLRGISLMPRMSAFGEEANERRRMEWTRARLVMGLRQFSEPQPPPSLFTVPETTPKEKNGEPNKTQVPFTRYNLLSNRLSNRLFNRFDNQLYRVKAKSRYSILVADRSKAGRRPASSWNMTYQALFSSLAAS